MTAKKLAKMSEEERAAYLEQQRLEEEESKRKKEEMLNRFLKDKLSKEEQSTKLNILKLQEQWRNIMRKGLQYSFMLFTCLHYSLIVVLLLFG